MLVAPRGRKSGSPRRFGPRTPRRTWGTRPGGGTHCDRVSFVYISTTVTNTLEVSYGWLQCWQAGDGGPAGLRLVVGYIGTCPVHVWIDRGDGEGSIGFGRAWGYRYGGEPGYLLHAHGYHQCFRWV